MNEELLREIETVLERCGGEHFPESVNNYATVQANATGWLRLLIKEHYQLRGALGYEVPGHIIENPEIQNGIAQAIEKQNEGLKAALIEVRAAVWDEYVPASLSAKVHRIVEKAL